MGSVGLLRATDEDIYLAARKAGAVIVTKDRDFLRLIERRGTPPQVIGITAGNTSNKRLQELLVLALPAALDLLEQGEPFVKVGDSA